MKFFDRGSDIVVSRENIEESVSKQEFVAEVSGQDLKIFGQAGTTQIYLFSQVEEPLEPDVATLVDTLNTWQQISLRQKMTTVNRLAIPSPTSGIRIYDTDLKSWYHFDGDEWVTMGTIGLEGLFLSARGNFGTGGGWADQGFIELFPVLLFAQNLTERAVYMFFVFERSRIDDIDPEVGFVIYSTTAPSTGEAVRWRLTTKYINDGDPLDSPAAEVILQTQVLFTEAADSRQDTLFFTLDRSLMSKQDTIHLNLERVGGDALDTYGSDIGIGQSGMIIETNSHNPNP